MLRVVISPNGKQKILEQLPDYHFKVYDQRGKGKADIESHFEKVRLAMSHKVYLPEQWPLFEIAVTLDEASGGVIHFSIDEWIIDAVSFLLILQEWYQRYKQPHKVFPKPSFSFRDYVLSEKEREREGVYTDDLAYWTEKLSHMPGGPVLPWATKRPEKPQGQNCHFRKRYIGILPKAQWDLLKEKADALKVSSTVLLLSLFTQLLAKWSQTKKFSLTLTFFNRLPIYPGIDNVVGPFISTSIFIADEQTNPSFQAKVQGYQRQLWNDVDHIGISGVSALRKMRMRKQVDPTLSLPVVFTSTIHNVGKQLQEKEATWIEKTIYGITQTPQVFLDHQVSEREGDLHYSWDLVEAFFEPQTVNQMFAEYGEQLNLFANGQTADFSSSKQEPFPLDKSPLSATLVEKSSHYYLRFILRLKSVMLLFH